MKITHSCFLLMMLAGINANAQIKIGLPLGMADSSAVLDLCNTGGNFNKGILLPQVNLSSTIVWGLLGTVVTNGMLVYNNATAGSGVTAVIPGMYIWTGGKWMVLIQGAASGNVYTNCSSAAFSPLPSSNLVNNNAYNATYSLTYSSGSGAAYSTITQTINGLTLTRSSGIYNSSGGTVNYTLSGTYTGTTNSTVSFNIADCNTSVNYGSTDFIRAALSTSLSNYDAAIVGNWVNITAAEYANEQNIISNTTVLGISSSSINSSAALAWGGGGWVLTNTSNMMLAANNYLFGVAFKTGPAPTSLGANTTNIGISSTSSGSYASFPSGANMPAVSSFTAGTSLYFIFKKPAVINSTATYLGLFVSTTDGAGYAASTNGTSQKGASSYTGTIPNVSASNAFGADQPNNNILVQFLTTSTKQW